MSNLVDGTYELVPEYESEQHEGQVNLTEAAEDPNQSSEEPKTSYAQEGKPRSITYYFLTLCNLSFLYILVHLNYRSCLKP